MEGPGARQREEEPLGPLLGPEITVAAGDCTCHEEEELVKGGKIVNWRPRKDEHLSILQNKFLLLWRLQLELFNKPPLEECQEEVVMMKQDSRLARNVSDSESHQSRFSGCPCYESDTTHSDSSGPPIQCIGDFDDFQSDLENWELDDEACVVFFPELKSDSQYEEEDWDKELEDAECNPYDAEDIDYGSLLENCLLASCTWQEESLYNPKCHHAAPLSLSSPNRMPEVDQFDDADD